MNNVTINTKRQSESWTSLRALLVQRILGIADYLVMT